MAESNLQELAAVGIQAQKVMIDAETLDAWCRENNRVNDAGSRAELASRLLNPDIA